MIKLVMGLKGTGKTKELISTVNSVAKTAEGSVICLERDDKLRYEIDPKVRLISTDEYGINDYDMFFGFIGGLRASNYDITEIFVDSITKICRSDNVEELETFLDELEAIAEYDFILANLKNERVAAVIKRIRLDEEFHVKVLRELLNRYSCGKQDEPEA